MTSAMAQTRRQFILLRLALWPFSGKGWRKWAKIAVVSLCIYNLYAYVTMRSPPVWGRVVDKETGKPVAGVEVYMQTFYTGLAPGGGASLGYRDLGHAKTSGNGFFFISGSGQFALLPWWPLGTGLVAYSPGYVTCNAGHPFGPRIKFDPNNRVRWVKISIVGHFINIVSSQAKDQDQWKQKCVATICARDMSQAPQEVAERWMFNDLTGYLERWPQGQKAGEFVVSLADLAIARGVTLTEGKKLLALTTCELEKTIEDEKLTLAIMDRIPVSALSNNPVKQSNWPGDRAIIASFLSKLEGELARRKGGGNLH